MNVEEKQNYPELKSYLENSDETGITLKNLLSIFNDLFNELNPSNDFNMLDVGGSDGELTLPFISTIKKQFYNLKVTSIEPEFCAYERLLENKDGQYYLEPKNLTIQEFLTKNEKKEVIFDLILFSQCWYHFPKSDWDFIFNNAYERLNQNGALFIIMDSHLCEAYKLMYKITNGIADTLEYGDLFTAEDLEIFLDERDFTYDIQSFPIYIKIKNTDSKYEDASRYLAFLYRTYTENILSNYLDDLTRFLENCKNDNVNYYINNLVKVLIITKKG